MNNVSNIKDQYQLNSILDIYDGYKNNQTTNSALQYYIDHNSIPNGIILSDKVRPVHGMHQISYTHYYSDDNQYDYALDFYPLLLSAHIPTYVINNYKLISAKDIDFENAYLKYAQPSYDYDEPISYYDLTIDNNGKLNTTECTTGTTYSFNRAITPYINNTYDLLNIVDYLLNRVNCLNFLLEIIKEQKNVAN